MNVWYCITEANFVVFIVISYLISTSVTTAEKNYAGRHRSRNDSQKFAPNKLKSERTHSSQFFPESVYRPDDGLERDGNFLGRELRRFVKNYNSAKKIWYTSLEFDFSRKTNLAARTATPC